MVIKELLRYGINELKCANIASPQLDATVLICHLLECDRVYLTINDNKEASPVQEAAYKNMIEKRKRNMPVSYITNTKEFMSLDFYVDENVLIPRPDTEILVEYVIGLDCKKENILDICCGSGCIGVSLAHYIEEAKKVTMLDISDNALKVAKKNASAHCSDKCDFIKMDILRDFPKGKFDIIVSNPPYIDKKTLKTLESDVIDYEPIIALDGGESGLIFYERIAEYAYNLLNPNGVLVFETGDEQGEAVWEILEKNNYKGIKLINDLANRNRVAVGWRE